MISAVSPSRAAVFDLIDATGHLNVRAIPGAKIQKMAIENGGLKIWVRTAPEDGKASNAIIEFLATFLRLPKTAVKIVQGQTSRNKKVHVTLP